MPVQNSNFQISARPGLATYLLRILIPTTFNSLVCQKGQFTLQPCPRRWFVRQCLSQELETECLKLAVVKFLGVQIFQGGHSILLIFQS